AGQAVDFDLAANQARTVANPLETEVTIANFVRVEARAAVADLKLDRFLVTPKFDAGLLRLAVPLDVSQGLLHDAENRALELTWRTFVAHLCGELNLNTALTHLSDERFDRPHESFFAHDRSLQVADHRAGLVDRTTKKLRGDFELLRPL